MKTYTLTQIGNQYEKVFDQAQLEPLRGNKAFITQIG